MPYHLKFHVLAAILEIQRPGNMWEHPEYALGSFKLKKADLLHFQGPTGVDINANSLEIHVLAAILDAVLDIQRTANIHIWERPE